MRSKPPQVRPDREPRDPRVGEPRLVRQPRHHFGGHSSHIFRRYIRSHARCVLYTVRRAYGDRMLIGACCCGRFSSHSHPIHPSRYPDFRTSLHRGQGGGEDLFSNESIGCRCVTRLLPYYAEPVGTLNGVALDIDFVRQLRHGFGSPGSRMVLARSSIPDSGRCRPSRVV